MPALLFLVFGWQYYGFTQHHLVRAGQRLAFPTMTGALINKITVMASADQAKPQILFAAACAATHTRFEQGVPFSLNLY
jgi:hypothetical protein